MVAFVAVADQEVRVERDCKRRSVVEVEVSQIDVLTIVYSLSR